MKRSSSRRKSGTGRPPAAPAESTAASTLALEASALDMDALRLKVLRRLRTFQDAPRRCSERACRRAKACAGKDLRCLRERPLPPVSEEEGQRRLAEAYACFKRRAAELGLS